MSLAHGTQTATLTTRKVATKTSRPFDPSSAMRHLIVQQRSTLRYRAPLPAAPTSFPYRKRTSTAALATPRQDDIRSTSAVVSSEWPREGRLEVSSVIMRYRSDLSPALRGVSLVVEPGQKVQTTQIDNIFPTKVRAYAFPCSRVPGTVLRTWCLEENRNVYSVLRLTTERDNNFPAVCFFLSRLVSWGELDRARRHSCARSSKCTPTKALSGLTGWTYLCYPPTC